MEICSFFQKYVQKNSKSRIFSEELISFILGY